MSNIFVISDTHFGHANILTFKQEDGSPVRSFASVEEMDEHMIAQWNATVRPHDKVYHLGDLGFKNATYLNTIMVRLNGEKVLIKGNHDQLKMSNYAAWFKDVRSTHQLDRIVLSHVPIHPYSLDRWRGNVHGHLHTKVVPRDPRYFNVSVERINYTPLAFEEIRRYYIEVDKQIAESRARADMGIIN